MGRFKNWISQDSSNELVVGNNLTMILDEINTHDKISIKVAGIFPITYGLLMSVRVILYTTYMLLCKMLKMKH